MHSFYSVFTSDQPHPARCPSITIRASCSLGADIGRSPPSVPILTFPPYTPVGKRHHILRTEVAIHLCIPFRSNFRRMRGKVVYTRENLVFVFFAETVRAASSLHSFTDFCNPCVPFFTFPMNFPARTFCKVLRFYSRVSLPVPLPHEFRMKRPEVSNPRHGNAVGAVRASVIRVRPVSYPRTPFVAVPASEPGIFIRAIMDHFRRNAFIFFIAPFCRNRWALG